MVLTSRPADKVWGTAASMTKAEYVLAWRVIMLSSEAARHVSAKNCHHVDAAHSTLARAATSGPACVPSRAGEHRLTETLVRSPLLRAPAPTVPT